MEKEIAHRAGAGNVEALATQDSFAPHRWKRERKKHRKIWMNAMRLDLLAPYQRQAALMEGAVAVVGV
jgi:hypothetical protein